MSRTSLFILIIGIVLFGGCSHYAPMVSDRTVPAANAIEVAQKDLAIKNYSAVDADLKAAALAIQQVRTQTMAAQQKLDKDEQYLKDHGNDWLGARTHRWVKWIVTIVSVMSFGLGVLKIFTPGSPILGIVYQGIMGVATAGASIAHWIGAALASRWTKKTDVLIPQTSIPPPDGSGPII